MRSYRVECCSQGWSVLDAKGRRLAGPMEYWKILELQRKLYQSTRSDEEIVEEWKNATDLSGGR